MNRKTLSIFGDKICELPLTHLQNVMYSVGKGWANTVAGKLPFCGFMTALDHLTSMDVHHVLNKSALDYNVNTPSFKANVTMASTLSMQEKEDWVRSNETKTRDRKRYRVEPIAADEDQVGSNILKFWNNL